MLFACQLRVDKLLLYVLANAYFSFLKKYFQIKRRKLNEQQKMDENDQRDCDYGKWKIEIIFVHRLTDDRPKSMNYAPLMKCEERKSKLNVK